MKKQLYKLTALKDCIEDEVVFEKDDVLYTYRPERFSKENFKWEDWDSTWVIM